jgi:hypothetical protein
VKEVFKAELLMAQASVSSLIPSDIKGFLGREQIIGKLKTYENFSADHNPMVLLLTEITKRIETLT